MIRLNKIIFLFILAHCFACQSGDLPEPKTGDPVFFFSGTIGGGESRLINAGDDQFFMFTEFESDDQNVFSYIARLAKLEPDCGSDCSEQLRILIRHNSPGIPTSDSVNIALSLGDYELKTNQNTGDTLTKNIVQYENKSTSSSPVVNHNWTLPGSTFDGETPPIDTMQQLDFNVELEIVSDTLEFCTSSIVRTVTLDPSSNCGVSFDVFSNPVSSSIQISAIPSGTGPFDYSWDNGIVDSTFIFVDSVGQHCVTVTDALSCSSTNCIEYVNDSPFNKVYCSAAFNYQLDLYQEIITVDPLRLSQVTIEYTDARGNTYSSKLGAQPEDSNFSIVSNTDFEDNENGFPTKMMIVNFKALLYDESGSTMPIESERSSLGIAYPN